MNKERNVIESNAVVVFDGDIEASVLNNIAIGFPGEVIINGDLIIDENLKLECDLYVEGNVEGSACYAIEIEGDLYCYGIVDCYDICVNGCFYSDARVDATDIKVRDDFWCGDGLEARASSIIVGGDFECYSIETQEIYVFGRMKVDTGISATIIKIGY